MFRICFTFVSNYFFKINIVDFMSYFLIFEVPTLLTNPVTISCRWKTRIFTPTVHWLKKIRAIFQLDSWHSVELARKMLSVYKIIFMEDYFYSRRTSFALLPKPNSLTVLRLNEITTERQIFNTKSKIA
jgi:hypothetical protein